MKPFTRLAVLSAVTAALALPMLAAAETPPIDLPDHATFGALDIPAAAAHGLGLACNEVASEITCYLTQDEADAALAGDVVIAAGCTPGMQLYNGTSFTGASLTITTQSTWFNLSGFGFDNITSSWKAGCVAGRLASGAGGGGTLNILAAGGAASSLGAFNNTASSAKRCPC